MNKIKIQIFYLFLVSMMMNSSIVMGQEYPRPKEKKGKWAIVMGKKNLTEFKYDQIDVTYEHYFIARLNSKWGIINANGKEIIPFEYDQISSQFFGLLKVKKQGSFGIIDTLGAQISEIKYQEIDHITKDSTILAKENNAWVYVKNNQLLEGKTIVFKNPDIKAIFGLCQNNLNIKALEKCSLTNILETVFRNLKYPIKAVQNDIEGTVIVSFWISTAGKIENVKVLRGLGFGLDEEAIAVLKYLDKWQPAIKDESPVYSEFILPMKFVIK